MNECTHKHLDQMFASRHGHETVPVQQVGNSLLHACGLKDYSDLSALLMPEALHAKQYVTCFVMVDLLTYKLSQ